MKNYVYIFTRQDISPEQQLVQSAHVALKLGSHLGKSIDPDETYFTVVGVRDGDALQSVRELLRNYDRKHVVFYEPDIDGFTSVATYPIPEGDRNELLAFSWLKF